MAEVIYLNKNSSENFQEVLDQFRAYLQNRDRGRSIRVYVGAVKGFADWFSARTGTSPVYATTLDIVDYRRYLQEQERKPATVNRILVSLRIFFDWLVEQRVIPDNPAKPVKPVATAQNQTPKWLTRQEQSALMRAVREKQNLRDEALITLMLHTGLRVGEVVALTRGGIFISERAGKVIVRQGKGNKYREVPLNKTVRYVLQKWLEVNPLDPVFPNRYGKPISDRMIHRIIKEYAYHAKIRGVSPHTLRHTFCKNLIDAGVPIDQVAMMAGHSKLEITRLYTAPSINDLQAAVEKTAWE